MKKSIEPSGEVEPVDETHVRWRGQKLVYFGGCDYLRLSWHPSIRKTISKAFENGPVGVAASRSTTGNNPFYARVESLLASFFKAPTATLVPSGYLTNLVVAQALPVTVDRVFIDQQAHPTLFDAARLSRARVTRFRHRDAVDLRRRLAGVDQSCVVMTDAVFASSGKLAPLAEYAQVLPRHAIMLVDDCHGAGVLGDRGAGSLEHWGLGRQQVIQTITFSKAFGVAGGAILGPARLRRDILERSGAFTGSTPLAPALVKGIDASVRLMDRGTLRLRRLRKNVQRLRRGLNLEPDAFPVLVVDAETRPEMKRLSAALVLNGIHPP
ncbi:MAG: aminotransferase class I/II-fold pyridoxal phosphate-dependent enzyme, partial [Limisphaerales bacterium]